MTPSIAVIGTGRIGRIHAKLLAHHVRGAEVALVHDLDQGAAEAVGAELGVPVAKDIADVWDSEADAVAVCTSTDSHAELIVAAARAGKHVFCEKPVSVDLAEIDRTLAAVEEAGVKLQVGFNRRFDPSHKAVADAVAGGEIGEVFSVRIVSRDPAPPPLEYVKTSGGLFLDMTIHDFDMARYVAGSEVVDVFATGAVRVDHDLGALGDLDTAVVVLTHENGAITTIDNCRQSRYGYDQRVEVFGSLGKATSANMPEHLSTVVTAQGYRQPRLVDFFVERYLPSYIAQWETFARAIACDQPVPVTGADGRAPLVIGLAAWRSVREGRPVRCEEIG